MITITASGISPDDLIAVARANARVTLAPDALDAMRASRSIVDAIERDGRPVYGVSTGFGALANTFIAPERRADLAKLGMRALFVGFLATLINAAVAGLLM